jgi:ubiquinone/menaquinone biosynthesis C-methylase UbiE
MNTDRFYEIAYSTHRFANAVSQATLDRVLEPAQLKPGQRAVDLGCGAGAAAIHLARTYGLQVDGVDLSEGMLAQARARLQSEPSGPGAVSLHQASAENFMATAEAYDLIVVMGTTQFVTGAGERAEFFTALRRGLTPGGHLLYADPFWRRPPSATVRAVSAPFGSHADYVRAGESAGLQPRCALESPQADWDDYAWRMTRNVQDWLAGQPDGPVADAVARHARFMLDSYLDETRESMGFGLYLFRAP